LLWHLITGEYPPQPGGVSDYSRIIADGLTRVGDTVKVWAPAWRQPADADGTVEVLRARGHFGPAALLRMSRSIDEASGARILVQYAPHAFGCKGMNLPFCVWLFQRRRRIAIDVMFHELFFPIHRAQPLRHNFLGAAQRVMALLAARAARRIFIACQKWKEYLERMALPGSTISWLPVPSNIPVTGDAAAATALRRCYTRDGGVIIGHFGTYSSAIVRRLMETIPAVMNACRNATLLLIGDRSDEFRMHLLQAYPEICARAHATARLDTAQLSAALRACDVMIQPYPDGVDSRRGSMMALLAHGCAVVTNFGVLSESLWRQSAAVMAVADGSPEAMRTAVCELLGDESARSRLKIAARTLYEQYFDVRHTIQGYRAIVCESQ
jgi:glycosyltransferase involved in cell wall biosynthesis